MNRRAVGCYAPCTRCAFSGLCGNDCAAKRSGWKARTNGATLSRTARRLPGPPRRVLRKIGAAVGLQRVHRPVAPGNDRRTGGLAAGVAEPGVVEDQHPPGWSDHPVPAGCGTRTPEPAPAEGADQIVALTVPGPTAEKTSTTTEPRSGRASLCGDFTGFVTGLYRYSRASSASAAPRPSASGRSSRESDSPRRRLAASNRQRYVTVETYFVTVDWG